MGSGNPNPVAYRDLLRRIWSFDPDDGTGVICARLQDLGMNSYTWDSTRRDEVVLVERGSEHCRKNLDNIIALKISFQILTNLFAEDNLASSSTVREHTRTDEMYCTVYLLSLPSLSILLLFALIVKSANPHTHIKLKKNYKNERTIANTQSVLWLYINIQLESSKKKQ